MVNGAIFSTLLCFFSTAVVNNVRTDAEDSFRFIQSRDNVSLHERDIINEEGEQAREIKAVFSVRASEVSLVRLLRDSDKGTSWNPGASIYRVVLEQGQQDWVTHIEYDLPWPLHDHDAVLRHKLSQQAGLLEVYVESVDGVVAERKGVDRMLLVKGKWSARKVSDSMIEVSYQVSSKPSPVPRLITDPIVYYHMVRSMSALRRLLEESE